MTTITYRLHPTNPRFGFATIHYDDGTEYDEAMSAMLADALIEERDRLRAIETAAREARAWIMAHARFRSEADSDPDLDLLDRLDAALAASGEGG